VRLHISIIDLKISTVDEQRYSTYSLARIHTQITELFEDSSE